MPSLADRWYKQAVVYALDVETFQDSDGDGCGDFAGLTHRLDYLVNLGITCLWLLPFYPTPNRDNGYDVSDYYGVDPRLGSLGDFVEFMQAARERGLRVIIDLVVNHTSDQHPWFQAARHDRGLALPRLLPLVGGAARTTGSRGWCSRACRTASGRTTRWPAPGTSTASTPSSPT